MIRGHPSNVEEFDVYAICCNALNVLVSAFHLVQQRTRTEAATLMRVALEAAAAALPISRDPEARSRYLAGPFQSTKAISFATKLVPMVGELWGAMSNVAVHANVFGFGPQVKDSAGDLSMSVEINLGARKQEKWQDEMNIATLCLVSNVVLKLMLLTRGDLVHWPRTIVGIDRRFLADVDVRIIHYQNVITSIIDRARRGGTVSASAASETV